MDRKKLRHYLNFEILAKFFFDLAEERYPSAEKVKQMAARLVDPMQPNEIEGIYIKIALLNAMRDMIKEVAPSQLYRSFQHRDDLYLAIIEASEDFEDDLEELEEEAEEEKE